MTKQILIYFDSGCTLNWSVASLCYSLLQVKARIGSPVTGYGSESRNRAARQRIPNKIWTDEDGVEHVEVTIFLWSLSVDTLWQMLFVISPIYIEVANDIWLKTECRSIFIFADHMELARFMQRCFKTRWISSGSSHIWSLRSDHLPQLNWCSSRMFLHEYQHKQIVFCPAGVILRMQSICSKLFPNSLESSPDNSSDDLKFFWLSHRLW